MVESVWTKLPFQSIVINCQDRVISTHLNLQFIDYELITWQDEQRASSSYLEPVISILFYKFEHMER